MGHIFGIIFGFVGLALVLLTGAGAAQLMMKQAAPSGGTRADQDKA